MDHPSPHLGPPIVRMMVLSIWTFAVLSCSDSGETTQPADAGADTIDAQIDALAADSGQDGSTVEGFTRIVQGGIDDRLNGYPWAMELFDGDGDGTPEVYVGTVQNPLCVQTGLGGMLGASTDEPPARWKCPNELWGNWLAYLSAASSPGHVYRGRFDEATRSFLWDRVFSPTSAEAVGFRGARVFDGALYILGVTLAGGDVWRTTDGETFEKASPPGMAVGGAVVAGGLRGAQVFKGKLYVANNGICEIYASDNPSTDPSSWQQVNSTGFVDSGGAVDTAGNPVNGGMWQLGVFDGHLYAGTTNLATGAELWKSDDPKPGNWTRVIEGGFGNTVPQGFMTIRPFGDHLYLGTVLYPIGAETIEGCDILRLDAEDNVELLVGKTRASGEPEEIAPLSGLDSGFDYDYNLYSWYMAEYDGWLYVGTYDSGSQVIDFAEERYDLPFEEWSAANHAVIDLVLRTTDHARQGGADLWRTKDGTTWEAINLDGFGDRDNYGIRNMLVTPWGFMVATGNAVDGFEIWLSDV